MDDQDLTAASDADFVSFTSCLPDCHPGHPFIPPPRAEARYGGRRPGDPGADNGPECGRQGKALLQSDT